MPHDPKMSKEKDDWSPKRKKDKEGKKEQKTGGLWGDEEEKDDFTVMPIEDDDRVQPCTNETQAEKSAEKSQMSVIQDSNLMKFKTERVVLKRGECHNGWAVVEHINSGLFGDIYVVKSDSKSGVECIMKSEIIISKISESEKQLLRLKLELAVYHHMEAHPGGRRNFAAHIDMGITANIKYIVMERLGLCLPDLRKQLGLDNFSNAAAFHASVESLRAIRDLHMLGWLHRNIQPRNFLVGLKGNTTKTREGDIVYLIDFGIARQLMNKNSPEMKTPRPLIKRFLGHRIFAPVAAHLQIEQSAKDDIESWVYSVFDLFDHHAALPWKNHATMSITQSLKQAFMMNQLDEVYANLVKPGEPGSLSLLVDDCNNLTYEAFPDYVGLEMRLRQIKKQLGFVVQYPIDWAATKDVFMEDNDPRKQDWVDDLCSQDYTMTEEQLKKLRKLKSLPPGDRARTNKGAAMERGSLGLTAEDVLGWQQSNARTAFWETPRRKKLSKEVAVVRKKDSTDTATSKSHQGSVDKKTPEKRTQRSKGSKADKKSKRILKKISNRFHRKSSTPPQ